MQNRQTAAARAYHTATNHSLESVRRGPHGLDWANQPRPYKLYTDIDGLPLPGDSPTSTVPALTALTSNAELDAARIPDLQTLTAVLQFSAGITKRLHVAGGVMDFRAAACTGALYHIEVYAVCGRLPGLSAGVYHFGVHDLALRKLRDGDFRGTLVDAAGGEAAVSTAPVVLVFTTTFWRNSWKYQARAYRHAFWDSGTILANLLALAAAHDLPARIVTGFVDGEVNRLLGLDTAREVALVLVPLGSDPAARPGPAPASEPLHYATAPLSRTEVDYPIIRDTHAASSLTSPREVEEWRLPGSGQQGAGNGALPSPSGAVVPIRPLDQMALPEAPIETVIRGRGSARRFETDVIGFEALSTMLLAATHAIPADFLDASEAALSEPYLIVNAVDGLASGAYAYRRDLQALELLQAGDFREQAGYLDLGQELAADAAVNVYFLAELDPILAAFGNRGYRVAQLDASIAAGKLYLAAYALGLGATGLTFFDDDVVQFFSPHAQGKSVMFLLAAGVPARRRPR